MEKNKPWILYSRVSTREQHTENQGIKLKEYAGRMGYKYCYFDEIESTRKTRPIKAKVLSLLRSGAYAGVIVLKFDRWARSLSELSIEVLELHKKHINFISLKENIDLSTSAGKLQLHIFGAFAEFERDLIRERTLDGLARVKAQGQTLGRPIGSKDSSPRKKAGYYIHKARQRQKLDEDRGIYQSIEHYLNNPPLKNKTKILQENSCLDPPVI